MSADGSGPGPRPEGRIGLEHGSGGPAMRALIEGLFAEGFGDPEGGLGLGALDDGAALRLGDRWLVVTTDSHVIKPIFFPGGDIGRLAVSGTVNDLAVMGATEPMALTCAVILEEGFLRADLERIWRSVRETCREVGVAVVTGDTKVMGRGEIDGIAINTTGLALADRVVSDGALCPGDRLLLTGTLGDHGLAVMATRNQLALESDLVSDVAPLSDLLRGALEAGGEGVVAMKDPTRGGFSSALHELAAKSGVGILIDEASVPIRDEVRAVGELLGIDPLQVANEGKAVLGVRPGLADAVLAALRGHPRGRDAAIVGTCIAESPGRVILDTGFGNRLLSELSGDPLPRIC